MLKGACVPEYFCERHSIVLAPSLTSTRFKPKGLNKTEAAAGEEEKLSSELKFKAYLIQVGDWCTYSGSFAS